MIIAALELVGECKPYNCTNGERLSVCLALTDFAQFETEQICTDPIVQ